MKRAPRAPDAAGRPRTPAHGFFFEQDDTAQVHERGALARSFAEARMSSATALFDQLNSAAGGLGPYSEQVVAHGLLGAMSASHHDVRVDVVISA